MQRNSPSAMQMFGGVLKCSVFGEQGEFVLFILSPVIFSCPVCCTLFPGQDNGREHLFVVEFDTNTILITDFF